MPIARVLGILLGLGALLVPPAPAQPTTDTTVTWRSYSATGTTRVQVYPGPPDEEEDHTVVLWELAENRGPTVVNDLPYVADLVGRRLGIDPATAYWVTYWGGFSYEGSDPDADRALFLEATFSRTDDGDLGSPDWDVITETEVRTLTDRHWNP
jgi:hypothetical protein